MCAPTSTGLLCVTAEVDEFRGTPVHKEKPQAAWYIFMPNEGFWGWVGGELGSMRGRRWEPHCRQDQPALGPPLQRCEQEMGESE